jgi:hypothetical protein
MDDSGGGGGSVPTHQKYKTAAEALERTHKEELKLHENLTQKAIDILKVGLLSVSLLATGLSFAPSQVPFSLLLVASAISFYTLSGPLSKCSIRRAIHAVSIVVEVFRSINKYKIT